MIATQFHVSKGTVSLSVTSSLIGYIIGALGAEIIVFGFIASTTVGLTGRSLQTATAT